MKTIFVLIAAAFIWLLPQETPKLNGHFRIEFDKKNGQPAYQITFNDSTFVKKMPDAITYKGKIEYSKFKATIRQNKEDDPIEIDNREIGKDTIKFTLKSKRDLSMTLNRGKLIKIK
ncbi:hypothetical protein [Flavobacterium sp.]|uniref:hypothetical protein n=1 Tax=Flavobacterium sp. TaxID=239 RepID=UPI0039E2B58F